MAKIAVSATVDENIVADAKARAEKERRSFSQIVEIALEQYIADDKKTLAGKGKK